MGNVSMIWETSRIKKFDEARGSTGACGGLHGSADAHCESVSTVDGSAAVERERRGGRPEGCGEPIGQKIGDVDRAESSRQIVSAGSVERRGDRIHRYPV